jgi:hypothetical protein
LKLRRREPWAGARSLAIVLAAATGEVLGCAAGSTPSSVTGAPAPTDPSVSYRPYEASYRAVTRRDVEQLFNGQLTRTQFALEYRLTVAVAEDGSELQATFTVDTVAVLSGLPPGEAGPITGTRFVARLGRNGALEELRALGGRESELLRQLSLRLQEFFPRLPPRGASVGARWSDTVETRVQHRELALTVRSVNRSEALGWVPWGGETRALHIVTVSDYTVHGAGVQAGQDLTVSGSGRAHAQQYVAPDGRLLGLTSADTLHSSVSLAALGTDIPITQTSVDSLGLVR